MVLLLQSGSDDDLHTEKSVLDSFGEDSADVPGEEEGERAELSSKERDNFIVLAFVDFLLDIKLPKRDKRGEPDLGT